MKTLARVLGTAALALGVWFLIAAAGSAADNKEARAAVLKIADLVEKKNDAGAKKEAAALAAKKPELLDVMTLFALRKRDGIGFGEKPGASPDGIEAKLLSLGRKPMPQAQLAKEAADLARAAAVTAAIAEIAVHYAPKQDMGMKKKKDWLEWTKEMREGADELAEAAKAKNPGGVKKAVSKVNSSCNNCHGVFRDA